MASYRAAQIICLWLALIASAAPAAAADDYPNHAIRMIIPFAPGGSNDVVGRIIANQLGEKLGKQVFVDNRPGAGGVVGSDLAAKADPDGYTLLIISIAHAVDPWLYKTPFDPVKDFAPVSIIATGTNVLSVNPNVPVHSVKELLDLAKAKPGVLNYASAGNGTLPHIEGELLKASAKIEMNHVPYRGGGEALTGLLAGQVQVMFSVLTQMLPYIQEGRLRGLAISSATRSKLAPEIPTMVESGFDQFVTTSINGLVAPPNTPIEIRRQLSEAVKAALASADVQRSLANIGGEPRPSSPEEFASYLAGAQQHWAHIIAATHISID